MPHLGDCIDNDDLLLDPLHHRDPDRLQRYAFYGSEYHLKLSGNVPPFPGLG